ncbi:Granulin repeat cysteine protease family protein [Abeliophyllum distichum]|uniref:Granulin repeat cysteine protease family protein n=1 Tax=Abeliophyllum distichum TaxID=126358 RepID=A0ABD1PWN5_9LAMI
MASYPTKESYSSSPFPSPAAPLPPSPSPPPPSPPLPSDCGDFSQCAAHETCCCLYEFYDFCLIYGCCACAYENAVCCEGTEYCFPGEFPICDVDDGLCLKSHGDSMGVAANKRQMAKHNVHALNKNEETHFQWKTNPFAVIR